MKIIAAIIGTGVGLKHLEAIHNYKNSLVKIICEKDKTKLKFLKKKFPQIKIVDNEDQIFSDKQINLVSIASYDNYHFSQIVKCIKNKKNIIVEKPMCLKILELKKINKLIKNEKIKIISNLPLRVNSFFLNLKKKIPKNKVYYMEADYIWGRPHKLLDWRSKIKDYSITLGAGIHMIDLVMWLLKSKPISVQSFGNNLGTKKIVFKKKSFALFIFEFPNNLIVKITANAASIYNHFHELKIFTNNETITHCFAGTHHFIKKKNKIIHNKINAEYPDKKNRKKLIQNFIDNLLNKNIKPIISFKEQLDLMNVCFAADKSIQTKKKIKINY
jgi:predicted dehydrogenase